MPVRATHNTTHRVRRTRPATGPGTGPAPIAPVALTRLLPLPGPLTEATASLVDACLVDSDGTVAVIDAQLLWGWGARTSVSVVTGADELTVTAGGRQGTVALDRHGRLLLPLAWRRIHRLEDGGRVVVVTAPDGTPTVTILPADHAARRITATRTHTPNHKEQS